MPTIRSIVEAAYTELNVKPPDQTLSAENASWGLDCLNRMLDRWKTRSILAYTISKLSFTWNASQQTYSIGPSGADFTAARPVKIERANYVFNSTSPANHAPIQMIGFQEYADLSVPDLDSSVVTQLYYDPTVPNGTLYPWPYPTVTTDSLELFVLKQIGSSNALDDSVDLPPGYHDCLIWNLAAALLPSMPALKNPEYVFQNARKSLQDIQGLNLRMPPFMTSDFGSGGGGGMLWNYMTGDFVRRG